MKNLVFLSGAGLSAPSGLSTFRDADGLWEHYLIDEVCNINTWRKNYLLVHEFYNKRRKELASVQPNKMHECIAKLCEKASSRGFLVHNFTQNVDDLCERAGCKSVLHLHGNLWELFCTKCKQGFSLQDDFSGGVCEHCGGLIKPNVVFFGEQAPMYERLWQTFGALSKDDLVVIIGTSGAVININSLLRCCPAASVLINLEPSKYIDENLFSTLIYKSCDEAAGELASIVECWLDEASF